MATKIANNPSYSTSNNRAGFLGILWAVYGVARLVIALVLIFFSGTTTLMFGALLPRVPIHSP